MTEMTPEQLAEAKRYGRQDLICDLLDRMVDVLYLGSVVIFFAWTWEGWLEESMSIENYWCRLAAMFLLITGIHILVSFPISMYRGHWLEHKFKLSTQTFRSWLWRYTKRNILTLFFGVAIMEGLFAIIFWTGSWWWLVASAGFFLLSVGLGQLAPILILPLFYSVEKLENEELAERFTELSKGTGLSIEGVYRMSMSDETVKANAMLAGLGRTRRVILGDTLLDDFSREELEVVFAHEVGHHVHRHIRTMILAGLIYSVLGFFLCHQVVSLWTADAQWASDAPIAVLAVLMLSVAIFSQLLEPVQNAISRHFERQSDRYALDRTLNPEAYRSAFTKLAVINKADPNPNWLEVFLFHSHPPISERLSMSENS